MDQIINWVKQHKQVIPFVFYAALLIFLGIFLRNFDYQALEGIEVNGRFLALSALFALSFRYWGAFIWFVLLKGLGARQLKNIPELIYVYAKSWLGRYIPGTAPWILGKIYFASQQGISKKKLAVSSLLEGALQIVVVMFLAFLMLIADQRLDVIDSRIKYLMAAVIIISAVAMVPAVFNWLVSRVYSVLKRKELEQIHLPNGRLIFRGAVLYGAGSFLSGLAFFFLTKALYPELTTDNLFFVMGASNLAGAVSMLAIFVPSGLGVREGVQLVLLSAILPKEVALVVTLAIRLWAVAMDLTFFFSARLLRAIQR